MITAGPGLSLARADDCPSEACLVSKLATRTKAVFERGTGRHDSGMCFVDRCATRVRLVFGHCNLVHAF
jgi:hypothetical protein